MRIYKLFFRGIGAKEGKWWLTSIESIGLCIAYVRKYYSMTTDDIMKLTMSQLAYYSDMIVKIENPKEYEKQRRRKSMQDKTPSQVANMFSRRL